MGHGGTRRPAGAPPGEGAVRWAAGTRSPAISGQVPRAVPPPRGRPADRAAVLRREPTALRDCAGTGGGSGHGRGPPAAAGQDAARTESRITSPESIPSPVPETNKKRPNLRFRRERPAKPRDGGSHCPPLRDAEGGPVSVPGRARPPVGCTGGRASAPLRGPRAELGAEAGGPKSGTAVVNACICKIGVCGEPLQYALLSGPCVLKGLRVLPSEKPVSPYGNLQPAAERLQRPRLKSLPDPFTTIRLTKKRLSLF